MNTPKTVNKTVRITEDQDNHLRRYAQELGVQQSQLMRKALDLGLQWAYERIEFLKNSGYDW